MASLTLTMRNENNRYLQDDGTVASAYNSFQIAPDVPGALSTTWQKEITVPDEGLWKAQIRANDIGGQSSLDTADRELDRVRHRAGTGRVDQLSERGDPADGAADVHGRAGPADHLHRLGDR